MREEVYNYLHEYGFSAIEIDKIEDTNDNMFDTNLKEIRKNITFLQEKYLDIENIIELVNENPFMLTEKNDRLEALDKIYNIELGLGYEELKDLMIKNSRTYTLSPMELQKIIDYLKEHNYNIETIRNFILKNPQIISLKFNEFIKLLNNN